MKLTEWQRAEKLKIFQMAEEHASLVVSQWMQAMSRDPEMGDLINNIAIVKDLSVTQLESFRPGAKLSAKSKKYGSESAYLRRLTLALSTLSAIDPARI